MFHTQDVPKMPGRPCDAHKGTFGRVLIVGGSRNYLGAPALTANAALRSGAGLVTMALPKSVQQVVGSLAWCATSISLAEDEQGVISADAIPALLDATIHQKLYNVVAVGPGLGDCKPIVSFIMELNRAKIPCVIDADALNRLAETSWYGLLSGHCVITPHPGELSRLLGVSGSEIQADRERKCMQAVVKMRGNGINDEHIKPVCLLKGHHTLVADGERLYTNTTGNPGMATGGTGDILTGIIAALMAQGLPTFEATALGAHIHGLAGDLAAQELGEISMIAEDLLKYLPAAFKKVTGPSSRCS
jgi:NAD(P)H-hydrate epimerase